MSTSLSGDLDAAHLTATTRNVLPTDTQKNTAYAFAQQLGGIEPEAFALDAGRALRRHPGADHTAPGSRIEEYPWTPLGRPAGTPSPGSGAVHPHDHRHTRRRAGTSVVGAASSDLIVLNTTDSEFWGFPRDEYTTLDETKDRMLATAGQRPVALPRPRMRRPTGPARSRPPARALLEAFADTYSYSLQQTLYAIGDRGPRGRAGASARYGWRCRTSITSSSTSSRSAWTNDNEVYYAADRPYGLIEGTVLADDAPDAGLAWT